jgi:hypothetical protein
VEHLVSDDVFRVGINPMDVLKALDIAVLLPSAGSYHGMNNARIIANILLTIKKKKGFKLTIEFCQRNLNLDEWSAAFDVFRPVLEVFEQEGGRVRISVWCVGWGTSIRTVRCDVNDAIKHPESNWRRKAIAYFESVRPSLEVTA